MRSKNTVILYLDSQKCRASSWRFSDMRLYKVVMLDIVYWWCFVCVRSFSPHFVAFEELTPFSPAIKVHSFDIKHIKQPSTHMGLSRFSCHDELCQLVRNKIFIKKKVKKKGRGNSHTRYYKGFEVMTTWEHTKDLRQSN